MSEDVRHRLGDDPEPLRRRLAGELTLLLFRRERQLGRALDRGELARRVNVSRSSLYAYLKGTTLPRTNVFDRLLSVLGAEAAEMRELSTLRDTIEVAQQRPQGTGADRPAEPGHGTPDVARRAARVPLPRQLPPVTGHFAGREAELRRLDGILDEADASAAVIVTVDGSAGVGKSTLALRWAHQVKDQYPDGQLHVNLRGFDPEGPADPGEVLHRFLQALGAAPESIPAGLDAKAALYRSLLADRRILVVLDNAASSAAVRPLLPGTATCLAVVTGRNRLESLLVREGAHRLTLDVLPYREALSLLERWLGARRLAEQAAAADELMELCARLPLALSIVAARAAARPDGSLERLADRLRDVPDRLEALGAGAADLDLRRVFQTSYALLPEPAARLFQLLGTHVGPDIDAHACAALLGAAAPPRAELDALTGAHMLTEQEDGRFSSHDLLRAFARQLADRLGEADRRAAVERVLDYYLCTAIRAGRHIEPCRARELPEPGPSWAGPRIDGYADAVAWFTAEIPTLHATMEQAAAEGFHGHVWRLAWAATVFLRRTGRRDERVAVHRAGLAAAGRADDRAVPATSMRLLGDGLTRLGEHAEARELLEASLAECRAIGDARGAFQAHLSLSRLHDAAGAHAEALEHAEEALRSPVGSGDPLAEADALIEVTEQRERAGRCAEALPLGRRALDLYRGLRYVEGEAYALRTIGRIERRLGRTRDAIVRYERSLELDRRLGDRFWAAHVLSDLANAHEEAGEPGRARARRLEALAMFESIRHPASRAVRTMLDADTPTPDSAGTVSTERLNRRAAGRRAVGRRTAGLLNRRTAEPLDC
ncbi:ATP-binding protein [Actinomadura fibrosa]|uniref:ATP-binding protein n=1 Tax=Actinomadura fibrosa TaxID=111802 RepID=A0ABW2XR89_9ACTN|nr:helix-turn-helix domain-containing protein [Actinomadura fibrosa]